MLCLRIIIIIIDIIVVVIIIIIQSYFKVTKCGWDHYHHYLIIRSNTKISGAHGSQNISTLFSMWEKLISVEQILDDPPHLKPHTLAREVSNYVISIWTNGGGSYVQGISMHRSCHGTKHYEGLKCGIDYTFNAHVGWEAN